MKPLRILLPVLVLTLLAVSGVPYTDTKTGGAEPSVAPETVTVFIGPMVNHPSIESAWFREAVTISNGDQEIRIAFEGLSLIHYGQIPGVIVGRDTTREWLAFSARNQLDLIISDGSTTESFSLEADEVLVVWIEGSSIHPSLVAQVWPRQFWDEYGFKGINLEVQSIVELNQ